MNSKIRFGDKLFWHFRNIQSSLLRHRLATRETVVAETTHGKIKGLKRFTVYDQTYISFESIPYAKPPIGPLRFKAPQELESWTDVRNCIREPRRSVQIHCIYDKVDGSEDCLYLNVYTKNLTPNKPQPVMVWIHGGGFISGEANRDWYGPDYFMQRDVVLVTIQYRLNSLGFLSLSLPELEVPGNAGLKDQVMALRWVKANCTAFGGDPNCITVFGESAGAASTQYMSLTEQTRDLFHRHIIMSGYAGASWALNESGSNERAFKLGELCGYRGERNERKLLEYLLSVKAEDLVRMERSTLDPEERRKVMFPFAPVIEPYQTPSCVVPCHPREMLKTAWGNKLPLLVGNTSNEGLFFKAVALLEPHRLNDMETCVDFVPVELTNLYGMGPETIRLGQKIKQIHVQGDHPTREEYFELCTFVYFLLPCQRFLTSRLANKGAARTFMYRFDFDSEEIIGPYRLMRFGRGEKGVSHADELTYMFWNCFSKKLPQDSLSYRTIERMVGMWTQFAETGSPYSPTIDGLETVSWEPLKADPDGDHWCLNIGEELTYIQLPEMAKIRKWQALYDQNPELF